MTRHQTPAMKRVLARLTEVGGTAYLGPGVPKGTQKVNLSQKVKEAMKFFGRIEGNRFRRRLKSLGVTSEAAWCSPVTFDRLVAADLIRPVDLLPGVWQLHQSHGQ